MDPAAVAILATLIAYKVVLLGIGFWAAGRTRDATDFFLGGRRLGPVVAAISASASSSSAWTLLGVSGYAYERGLSAVWLFPSCVGGFCLNWFLVAPRLRRLAAHSGALTVTQVLAGPEGRPGRAAVTGFASAIVLFSLLVYVASQLQGAGKTFAATFAISAESSILIGSAIVIVYTLLGGFWAVSVTDTLQGLLMAGTAAALPLAGVAAVGGPAALVAALPHVPVEGYTSVTEGLGGAAALGLVLGFFGIGLGYPGQPHVVNRFMAMRDERAVAIGRRVALAWAAVVYAGMIVLGLAFRALEGASVADGETAFIAAAHRLFPPVASGVMVAAVLSAIMSTADSQLLVAASAVTHDLGLARRRPAAVLVLSRLVVLALSAGAVALALVGVHVSIFDRVLFAWTAMGAAFGPLLLLTLWRGPVAPGPTLAAMVTGFTLAVAPDLLGLQLGEVLERFVENVVPFVAAFAVARLWRA